MALSCSLALLLSGYHQLPPRSMSVEKDIRYELLARLCPNSTGAELRSVCTEAGMFAIRWGREELVLLYEMQQNYRDNCSF